MCVCVRACSVYYCSGDRAQLTHFFKKKSWTAAVSQRWTSAVTWTCQHERTLTFCVSHFVSAAFKHTHTLFLPTHSAVATHCIEMSPKNTHTSQHFTLFVSCVPVWNGDLWLLAVCLRAIFQIRWYSTLLLNRNCIFMTDLNTLFFFFVRCMKTGGWYSSVMFAQWSWRCSRKNVQLLAVYSKDWALHTNHVTLICWYVKWMGWGLQ